MPAEYLPEVAWETIVKDVQVADATHYYVSVYPENPNDPGADLMAVTVGSYLKDWIGHTFKVVEVNIGGIPLRLRVEDSFSVGTGPQQGLTGIVYKSPTGSPFLAPIRHFRLDESALDYSRAIELDVIWKNLLHLDQTTPQTVYGGQPTFDEGLKLGLTPVLSNTAGELYYDEIWKCLSINNGDGTVSQIPQEEHIYVYNNSASNILEGQAVYDTGSGTNGTGPTTTTVALAKADKISTSNVIGVATNNIPIGNYGKITIRGKINNINTSSFGVTGNTLYLSTTTAGLLTTTKPTAPNLVVRVGKLDVSSATVGSIEVSAISWRDMLEVAELKATQNPGISAETPIGIEDISIDYTNRIVTITPPLGYFHYFTDGNGVINKHEVVGPISFTPFTNTTGVWHFYFDNSGIVAPTQVPWSNFSLIAPVLRIVWDSTKTPDSAKALTIFTEYHINDISAIDHLWKHTHGSIWVPPGLDIFSNFLTSPGNPNADGRNTVIGLSSGTMMDDNLPFSVTNTATPTTFWQQNLGSNTALLLNSTNSAILKTRYKGGAGVGVVEDGTRYPFLWDIATNKPQYVNSSGVKTLVSNGYFFVYFVYGIPDGRVGNTVRITPAYSEYASQTDANAVTWETVQTQDEAARDTEIRPLYKLVFETKSSFGVGCKYTVLRSVVDIRKSVVTQTTSSIGSILASNVVYTPFTGITSTDVQSLGLELYNKFQGTPNYLPKYNSTGITPSRIIDDGTNVTIGAYNGYPKAVTGLLSWNASIPESDISFTDITNGDASINKHGYFPKLPTPTGKYLRDDLTWQTVSGGGASGVDTEVQFRNASTGALDSDSTFKYGKATGVLIAGKSFRDIPSLSNLFVGASSGFTNPSGGSNSFFGRNAGYSTTTGSTNTFIGVAAGYYNTSGYENTFLGVGAGNTNTTGHENTFLGRFAGRENTTGSYNTFVGVQAGLNYAIDYCIAIGHYVTKTVKSNYDFLLGIGNYLLLEGNMAAGTRWFRVNAAQLTRSTNATSSAIIVTGTATSVTTTQINDTSKTWTVNAYANKVVVFTSGTNIQQARLIISNTATKLTISGTILTDTTPTYKIIDATVITNDNLSTAYSFDLSSGNSHAVVLPEFTSVFDRSINTRIGIEGFASGARLYVVTQNSQSFKGQFISTGAQTTYLNADKESIAVMSHILGISYHWDVIYENKNIGYSSLVDADSVIWDCSTGLLKNISTTRAVVTLSITNYENGMNGKLIVYRNSRTSFKLNIPLGYGGLLNSTDGELWFDGTSLNLIDRTGNYGMYLEFEFDGTNFIYKASMLRDGLPG